MGEFNEEVHGPASPTPEEVGIAGEDRVRLSRALESLSPRSREVRVLRELEGCSYKECCDHIDSPVGTVMSSFSRARRQLLSALANLAHEETTRELSLRKLASSWLFRR